MWYVSEAAAQAAVTTRDAIDAIEAMFVALHEGKARVFDVVMAEGANAGERFSGKSGRFDPEGPVGIKVGTYWPGNAARHLPSHGSTTLLLDPASGFPHAVIRATWLTAIRTAAADAVAVRHLARPDATTLGIVGAGHQALFDVLAIREVRAISQVRVWNRTPAKAAAFAEQCQRHGLFAITVDLPVACASDIVVTATAASEVVVPAARVGPGTHISAMGSDARGKRELDPALLARATLFADVVAQAVTIGEFEAAYDGGLIAREDITSLGAVIAGEPGRPDPQAITIFDSSGIALQDLAIAQLALSRCIAAGSAIALG